MEFYPNDANVPEKLETHEFIFRPLLGSDAELDFAALIDSREMLRLWDQTDWPEDDFTVEENREELEEHEELHIARREFTYTIMNKDETRCLGCMYIVNLGPIMQYFGATDEELANIGSYEALTSFWVRQTELASGLEKRVLDAARKWFADSWQFNRVLFAANSFDKRQVELFENSGMSIKYKYKMKRSEADYLIFG